MEADTHQPGSGLGARRSPTSTVSGDTANAVIAVPRTTDAPQFVFGHAGDHALVYALLRAANQTPSYADFITWLDNPAYEPSDRLLIKHGSQIVAHVQLSHRMAWFDGVTVPVGSLQDLAALPECAHLGYEQWLISTAEDMLREAGAVVSLVRTDRAHAFRAAGWVDVRAHGYSRINVNDLLAHLSAQAGPPQRRSRRLRIRRWRHIELDGVRAVYAESAARNWGAILRTEPYWQWLVGRKAHSDMIVAIDGPDDWDSLDNHPQIVGYAVTHGEKILELGTLSEYARGAPRLLVRACQDAIERDHHEVSLHTPPSDPLHELIVTAGGTWRTDERGEGGTLLVKLLDPARWTEAIYPILRRRSKRAGLPRPLGLCFAAGQDRHRLVVTRRSSRLVPDEAAEADVSCGDPQTLAAILVGNLNVVRAREAGRIEVANDDAMHRLSVLFPPSLFWQSQFDLLRF